MKNNKQHSPSEPHFVRVYQGNLRTTLSSATWLKTTKELRKMGWQVTLTVLSPYGKQQIDNVEVLGFLAPEIYILRNIIYHVQIVWYLLMNWTTIDVIMFNQPSAPWFLPLLLFRRLRGTQFPLFVMDTRTVPMEDLQKAGLRDKVRACLYNSMNVAANAWFDGQTAITQRMAEKVNIPPERLWGVWPSGADGEEFIPAIEARQWPANDEPVSLIYMGMLHFERNLMSLCQAVDMALDEGMQFRLLLIGEGTEKENLEHFASHTAGRIQVQSSVPHKEVPAVLSRAHVGILPFPDEEKYRVSSPVKLFEYMAAGLPILATKIVCHTDVIGNGSYVFWATEANPEGLLNALRQVWIERASLSRMGMESAQASHTWTWEESANKLSAALLPKLHTKLPINQTRDLQAVPMDK